MRSLHSIVGLAACLAAGAALAHDAWIEPREGGFQVVFGHEGKLETATAAKIKALAAVDAKGGSLPLKMDAGDNPGLVVSGRPAVLTVEYDNGIWTKTVEGSRNLPKSEVPGALSANHVVKFGKTVLLWGGASARALGQRLEIVPLAAEAPQAGSSLAVQVLWEGKPLAGAKLTINEYKGGEKVLTADAEGKVPVPVAKGRNALQATHKVDLPGDPRADAYSASANLIFELR